PRHVAADPRGMVGHAVDHLAVGLAEEVVVLEEVDVGADVRHHDLLIGRRVALEQVRVGGIGVDHHLVDLRQAPLVALRELLVVHAEAPVRIARREAAVRGDLVHRLVVEDLVDDRKEVEAEVLRVAFDLFLDVAQICGQRLDRRHYFPLPRNSLMESMIASLPLISLVTTRSSSSKCSVRSLMNCPEPYGDSTWPYENKFTYGRTSFFKRDRKSTRLNSSHDQI